MRRETQREDIDSPICGCHELLVGQIVGAIRRRDDSERNPAEQSRVPVRFSASNASLNSPGVFERERHF